MANKRIADFTEATSVDDADIFLMELSGGGASRKATRGTMLKGLMRGVYNTRDYGADPSASAADNTTAINAAIAAAGNYDVVYTPPGSYNINALTPFSHTGLNFIGAGPVSTIFQYTPLVSGDIFLDVDLAQQTFFARNFSIQTSDTVNDKTAIRVSDISSSVLDNIHIISFRGSGTKSVGLETNGRETTTFSNMKIGANIPILLGENPNGTIDVDEFVFTNLYLLQYEAPPAPYKAALIQCEPAANIQITNVTFDGRQGWVGNGNDVTTEYGFYWVNPDGAASQSKNLNFYNAHTEHMKVGAYYIYIDLSGGASPKYLRNLNINGGKIDTGGAARAQNGVYVRNVSVTKINGLNLPEYTGSNAFDFDNIEFFKWSGCYTNINETGMWIDNGNTLESSVTASGKTVPAEATYTG